MSIEALDVVTFASRQGLVISYAIAAEALASVDRGPLEEAERARYEAEVWDGKGEPPIGTADRWLHGKDGSSLSAIEAIGAGGVVYFLFKDRELQFWQPHRADKPGRIHMVNDPGHPDHWQTAATAHVEAQVTQAVDAEVLRRALGTTLYLHEARGIPYSGTAKVS